MSATAKKRRSAPPRTLKHPERSARRSAATKAKSKTEEKISSGAEQAEATQAADHARAHHVVELTETLNVCTVKLTIPASLTPDPDRRIYLTIGQRLLVQRHGNEFQQSTLSLRLSELEDLHAGLRVCIDEGRRTGVLPPAEDRDRRFQRMQHALHQAQVNTLKGAG